MKPSAGYSQALDHAWRLVVGVQGSSQMAHDGRRCTLKRLLTLY